MAPKAPVENIESRLYDVVIGLTTTEVDVDLVETLTFRFTTVDGNSIAPSERIWKDQLKMMCGTTHRPAKWRLCLQLQQTKESDTLVMEMEIRPSYGISSVAANRYLDFHFVELHTSENAGFDQVWKCQDTFSNCYIAGQGPLPMSYSSPKYAFTAPNPRTCEKYLSSFRRPAAGCLEKYFVWDGADYISLWDMEQKSPVSLKLLKDVGRAGYSISDDKSMFAVLSGNLISINEMASGTEIRSTRLQGYSFAEVRFIQDDTQLLVQSSNTCSEFQGEHYGLILDASGLFIVAQILIPGYYVDVQKSLGADDKFYAAHGSRLHRFQLEDLILKPYSQPYIPSCDETCKDDLTALGDLRTTYKARNGLQFTAKWEQDQRSATAAVITMTAGDGLRVTRLLVPFEKHSSDGRVAVFLDKLHRLLVADGDIIMIWALPESEHGDLTLLFLGSRQGEWGTCQHQQLLCRDRTLDLDQPATVQHLLVEPPYSRSDSKYFLAGFERLFNLDVKDQTMKEKLSDMLINISTGGGLVIPGSSTCCLMSEKMNGLIFELVI
ncbi:hypothetical protein BGZ70_007155 [Mortierella alpina]|uniref:Uncharacterized protein n=1 Tax=Mortierella alpina TaxID=64518 RepID=A0A9P6J7A6_MORAP|nr:hypothetical protein BGZ70_007155 [Mortierella alpina]